MYVEPNQITPQDLLYGQTIPIVGLRLKRKEVLVHFEARSFLRPCPALCFRYTESKNNWKENVVYLLPLSPTVFRDDNTILTETKTLMMNNGSVLYKVSLSRCVFVILTSSCRTVVVLAFVHLP